jgi:hypothetical protein
MSNDISSLLNEWIFEPDDILVRTLTGDDGRNKIQLRVDLGILQMEMDGRPDGLRPEGFESWLDFFEHQSLKHDENYPDGPSLELSVEECANLWRESVQYYHRYLSFWHLGMYELCSRDTARNLRLFSFVRSHVTDDRLKIQFDQWRPYSIMMHTRSVATPLLNEKAFTDGLRVIESGIDAVRDFLEEYNQTQKADECVELVGLERWRNEIISQEEQAVATLPKSKIVLLRRKLEEAVADEQFEEAARLRDEIRDLSEELKNK